MRLDFATLVVLACGACACSTSRAEGRGLEAAAREERLCTGVAEPDLATGLAGLDVKRAVVLERLTRYGTPLVEGVAVTVALGDRSVERLDAVMRCRAARALMRKDVSDPLAVRHTSVRVLRDDGRAAIVQIRSRDPESATEIVRRVRESQNVIDLRAEYGEDGPFEAPPGLRTPARRSVRSPTSLGPRRTTLGP